MGKLVVAEFITLDGVIQAPGGTEEDTEGGFTHGGWTMPYWHDDIGARFMEAISQTEAFLLGRKTGQTHGGAFEPMEAGDPFGDLMNAMKKYVVSTTLKNASAWRNSTLIQGDVVGKVRELKSKATKDLYLDGSSVLAHTLIQADLVDEYRLLLYPVLLGGGKKLFPDGKRANLKVIESKSFPTGVMLMRYVPDRSA